MLLIHAFPLNARMWWPQLGLAETNWRILAPVLRGFDGADDDPPAASMDDYAGDLIDLLDRLKVEEAVIGGLSMGGYVTFAMFRHAPRYFRGMVLADTRADADTPAAAEARRGMLQLVREGGAKAVADQMLPRLVGATTFRERPDLVAEVRALIVANSPAAISGAVQALMTRADATPLLSTVHCPTLVLVGEEDAVTPPALSEALQRSIPGAELVVVPQAGHLSSFERPASFNEALTRFLEHRV